jgi:sulfite reductase alpha subunit-like flavoprotein
MISIVCDTEDVEGWRFSEKVKEIAEGEGIRAEIVDGQRRKYLEAMVLFVIGEKKVVRKVPGKYCVIGIRDVEDECEEYEKVIGYPPLFVKVFPIDSDEIALKTELIQVVSKQLIRIPSLKPVIYSFQEDWEYKVSSEGIVVRNIEEICCCDDYKVISISFDYQGTYEPASNLVLYPENSSELVNAICEMQDFDHDLMVQIPETEHFSNPISVKEALSKYCDLTGVIRKAVLKSLGNYSINPENRKEIDLLTSLKGKDQFRNTIENKQLTVLDILQLFHIKIPAGDFLQLLDPLKPRYYSLSSPSPNFLEIAVQIIDKTPQIGLFSKFALKLRTVPSPSLRGELKPSIFKLNPSMPHLFISNGCGISPFRSLLLSLPFPSAKSILVCGFRTPAHFLYQSSFEALLKPPEQSLPYSHTVSEYSSSAPVLDYMLVGYSRTGTKTYVQDILQAVTEVVVEFLACGTVFVCGGKDMGRAVQEWLRNLAIERLGEKGWERARGQIMTEVWG